MTISSTRAVGKVTKGTTDAREAGADLTLQEVVTKRAATIKGLLELRNTEIRVETLRTTTLKQGATTRIPRRS